jgi:hypothetical protein
MRALCWTAQHQLKYTDCRYQNPYVCGVSAPFLYAQPSLRAARSLERQCEGTHGCQARCAEAHADQARSAHEARLQVRQWQYFPVQVPHSTRNHTDSSST